MARLAALGVLQILNIPMIFVLGLRNNHITNAYIILLPLISSDCIISPERELPQYLTTKGGFDGWTRRRENLPRVRTCRNFLLFRTSDRDALKVGPHLIHGDQITYRFDNAYRTDIVGESHARSLIYPETSTDAVHRRKQFRHFHSFAPQFESLKWKTTRGPPTSARPVSSSYVSTGFVGMSAKTGG